MRALVKPTTLCVMALSVAGLGALESRADMTVTLANSHGTTGGGEFLATPSGFGFVPLSLGENSPAFETFCVEKNEYINFHDTFYVDISTEAKKGGFGGGPNDPLDTRTAFLYNEFINEQLSDSDWAYDYDDTGIGRVESANALQAVFWLFEEEIDDLSDEVSGDTLDLAEDFETYANDSTWTDIGNVRIMNLYSDSRRRDGDHAQDQLVVIPAPGAASLGLMGISLIALIRRRA